MATRTITEEHPRVPHWIILKWLGQGGMGNVYLAQHEKTQALAAVKTLRRKALSRNALLRFGQESIAVNLINDPGLARVFDAGEAPTASGEGETVPYFVMEYVEGETLRSWMQRVPAERRLGEAVQLGYQIASVMANVHANHVIHRDLKPENIKIVQDPLALGGKRPKILDFGIAKVLWPQVRTASDLNDPDATDFTDIYDSIGVSWTDGAGAASPANPAGAPPGAEGAGATLDERRGRASPDAETATHLSDSSPPPGVRRAMSAPDASGQEREEASCGTSVPPQTHDSAATEPGTPADGAVRTGPLPSTMPFTDERLGGPGTPDYMPDEQARPTFDSPLTNKVDVYALGVTLYEMIEGELPFERQASIGRDSQARAKRTDSIRFKIEDADVQGLLRQMLLTDPTARPDMRTVAADLRRIARREPEFADALEAWLASKKAAKHLLKGRELERCKAWATRIPDLTAEENAFLQASAEEQARHDRRTTIGLIAGVVTLAVALIACGVLYLQLRAKTDEAAKLGDDVTNAVSAERNAAQKARAADARARDALEAESEARNAERVAQEIAKKEGSDAFKALEAKAVAEQKRREAVAAEKAANEAREEAEEARGKAELARDEAQKARKKAEEILAEKSDEFNQTVARLVSQLDSVKDKLRDANKKAEEEKRTRTAAEDERDAKATALTAALADLKTTKAELDALKAAAKRDAESPKPNPGKSGDPTNTVTNPDGKKDADKGGATTPTPNQEAKNDPNKDGPRAAPTGDQKKDPPKPEGTITPTPDQEAKKDPGKTIGPAAPAGDKDKQKDALQGGG